MHDRPVELNRPATVEDVIEQVGETHRQHRHRGQAGNTDGQRHQADTEAAAQSGQRLVDARESQRPGRRDPSTQSVGVLRHPQRHDRNREKHRDDACAHDSGAGTHCHIRGSNQAGGSGDGGRPPAVTGQAV